MANDFILPLTDAQFNLLDQTLNKNAKPVRFLADGRACCIATGICCKKHSNIIYHPMYWSRSTTFIDQVVKFLKENNKGMMITVSYH